MIEEYSGVGSYHDRHGTLRWRFRRKGKTVSLPCGPGEPVFDEAYSAAVEGRELPKKAEVVKLPTAVTPKSMGAAWKLVLKSAEWKSLGDLAKGNNTRIADAVPELASRRGRTRPVEGYAGC